MLLSRLVNYYPEIFTKLAFLDIGYSTPGRNLTEQTVRFVNKMTLEKWGYSVFGYFLFFKESDAAELMDAHVRNILVYSGSSAETYTGRFRAIAIPSYG